MGSRSEESSTGAPQSPSVFGGSSNRNTSSFQCNICLDPAREPVVTLCGHLFCWPCLYEWLHGHSSSSECPVCKATVEEEDIVPLYSGGNSSTDHPRSRSIDGTDIPGRPAAGRRSARAQQPQPDMNSFHHHNIYNPWSMGWNQVAAMRHGDFSFPEAAAGGVAASLHHGWPTNVFHCWNGHGQLSHQFYHGHGNHPRGFWRHTNHRQQANVIWNMLFFLFVALVVANTISRMLILSYDDGVVLAAPEYCNANFTSYFTDAFWANPTLSVVFEGRQPCYFNTGVMVMELGRWRDGGYTEQIEEWMELHKRMRIYELGSLPPFLLVFAGRIAAVEHRWNQHGLGGDNYRGLCRDLHLGPVSLLHWSGKGKPWARLDAGRPCPLDALWAPYDLLLRPFAIDDS